MSNQRSELKALLDEVSERLGVEATALFQTDAQALYDLVQNHAPLPGPRWQDTIITDLIPTDSTVLDLGCGRGDLLLTLAEQGVRGQGVELNSEKVLRCIERGVPVIQADVDQGLAGFPDTSVDWVILEETLQTLHRPVAVLDEMLRVGRHGIVSFPNFGHWRIRLDLALRGRMPGNERLPHHWYDTPNIHLFTIADFLAWAEQSQVTITQAWVLADGAIRAMQPGDNLRGEEALFIINGSQT